MEIDEVADALYVLPPEAFVVARRTAAGLDPSRKKEITALRRPTVAAWIVNTLVRRDPLALEELLALGPALAEAQGRGDGDEVRALSQQRRSLLGEVASRAVELAGRSVSDAVLLEVESTLDAGLVDPASAAAVRSGRLVRALAFAGFGGVDLDGATAVPVSPTTGRATGADDTPATTGPSAAERTARAELERLEADALEAAGRLDDAVRALDTARETADRAAADLAATDEEVARAEEALSQARQRRTAVQDREREATSARTAAERAVSTAQARAEKARLALDARRRG